MSTNVPHSSEKVNTSESDPREGTVRVVRAKKPVILVDTRIVRRLGVNAAIIDAAAEEYQHHNATMEIEDLKAECDYLGYDQFDEGFAALVADGRMQIDPEGDQ